MSEISKQNEAQQGARMFRDNLDDYEARKDAQRQAPASANVGLESVGVRQQSAEVQRLREQLALQQGANRAQDERERTAAESSGMVHSCDWPGDVAEEVKVLREQVRVLREALQTLVDQGEPLRGDGELWSNWQPRVKEWRTARAALVQTEPHP